MKMTQQELAALRADYPEVPRWLVEREDLTLAQARELMELRRRAFPKTRPPGAGTSAMTARRQ